jgi:hypothetical protein
MSRESTGTQKSSDVSNSLGFSGNDSARLLNLGIIHEPLSSQDVRATAAVM